MEDLFAAGVVVGRWMGSASVAPDPLLPLMQQVQAGCPAAMRRLYVMSNARLFAVILRINRDRGESEEVLQDVFLKVWQQRASFDQEHGSVAAWLSAVAHNAAISSLRRRKCRPQTAHIGWRQGADEDDDVFAFMPCHRAGPLDTAMHSQAATDVRRSLRKLSCEQRESISLAYFEGLSHQEIATRLGRPLGSVKSMLRRGMQSMRPGLLGHVGAAP